MSEMRTTEVVRGLEQLTESLKDTQSQDISQKDLTGLLMDHGVLIDKVKQASNYINRAEILKQRTY